MLSLIFWPLSLVQCGVICERPLNIYLRFFGRYFKYKLFCRIHKSQTCLLLFGIVKFFKREKNIRFTFSLFFMILKLFVFPMWLVDFQKWQIQEQFLFKLFFIHSHLFMKENITELLKSNRESYIYQCHEDGNCISFFYCVCHRFRQAKIDEHFWVNCRNFLE